MIALIVLTTINTILTFLILACAGRIRLDHQEASDALINGHNRVAQRVSELKDELDGALDCLLTLDATVAESSPEVDE